MATNRELWWDRSLSEKSIPNEINCPWLRTMSVVHLDCPSGM